MDTYKRHLMAAIASSTAVEIEKRMCAPMLINQEMRLCDCTNCRMGKPNKCTTYNPTKKKGK